MENDLISVNNQVRCRIHRGCHEIGGNCVEIESQGKRIVLDIGLPLHDAEVEVPDISGFLLPDSDFLGAIISHPHPDHYGLLERVAEKVQVYMGAAARRIIDVSSFFTPLPTLGEFKPLPYSSGKPFVLGPFRITPFLIDHSAYDSHCFLIEVSGKRLFYSGDIRAHGRKSHLFDDFVAAPPQEIDVLICEGTQIGRSPDFAYPDENSVTDAMAEHFRAAKGIGLVWCSSQNIDRVISVFEAAKQSGRKLILDMYTAEILRATGADDVPKPGHDDVQVYLPFSQKCLIKRERAFNIPKPYYPHRIYPEQLAEAASDCVMIFRPSMLRDLKKAECLDNAVLITSVWAGYLPKEVDRISEMKGMGVQHVHVHTSGHATVGELKRFVGAFTDSRIVPIHLEDRHGFAELSPKVELKNDHEWWEV